MPKNLIKRGNAYYFCMMVGGKKIRKALGTNLTEARRRAKILRDRYRTLPAESICSVKEFGKRWLKEYVSQERSPKDHQTAGFRFRNYIEPVIGRILLPEIRVDHCRVLRSSLEGKGLKPQTVRHILGDVRCLLGYAVDVGVLELSPWNRKVLPKVPKRPPARLTDQEVSKIRRAMPEKCLLAAEIARLTGIRWGEERDLQWRQVIWELRHLILGETKNGEVRRVPIPEELLRLLEEERARTSSVFVLSWRPRHPRWAVDVTKRATGLNWHWHQFRHTFACKWLERGGSKEALRLILGHQSMPTTERYGRGSDEFVFAEARRLEKVDSLVDTGRG